MKINRYWFGLMLFCVFFMGVISGHYYKAYQHMESCKDKMRGLVCFENPYSSREIPIMLESENCSSVMRKLYDYYSMETDNDFIFINGSMNDTPS